MIFEADLDAVDTASAHRRLCRLELFSDCRAWRLRSV